MGQPRLPHVFLQVRELMFGFDPNNRLNRHRICDARCLVSHSQCRCDITKKGRHRGDPSTLNNDAYFL